MQQKKEKTVLLPMGMKAMRAFARCWLAEKSLCGAEQTPLPVHSPEEQRKTADNTDKGAENVILPDEKRQR